MTEKIEKSLLERAGILVDEQFGAAILRVDRVKTRSRSPLKIAIFSPSPRQARAIRPTRGATHRSARVR